MAEPQRVKIPSEALLEDIQKVVQWWRAHGKGKLNTSAQDPNKDAFFAPETYVALTPLGGIPGLSIDTGTGSPERLNSAECKVYRVEASGLLTQIGRSQTVYNLNDDDIPGSTFVVVTRLKERVWMALFQAHANGVQIAVAPPGGLTAAENDCNTAGTGTGTGTLDPAGRVTGAWCNVYRVSSTFIRLEDGGMKFVYNMGPNSIPECAIFLIWEDPYGQWLTEWFGSSTVAPTGCTDFTICNQNYDIETVHACPSGSTVTFLSSSLTGTADCTCTPDNTWMGTGTCDQTSFTLGASTVALEGTELTGGGTVSAHCLGNDCEPVTYCFTGPTTYDAGNGVTCQVWEASSSRGSLKLEKCDQYWCISGVGEPSGETFIKCFAIDGNDACGVTTQFPIPNLFFFPPTCNQITTIKPFPQLVAEACGPKCWVDNTTGVSFCSGSDESSHATEGAAYVDQASCEAACFNWACWQSNTLTPTDAGYRFCSQTDDSATATRLSTWSDGTVCNANCQTVYCIQWIDYDDEACSVNPHPTTTVQDFNGNVADYTFCADLSTTLGGCFSNGIGGSTQYQIVDGPYDNAACDGACGPLGG